MTAKKLVDEILPNADETMKILAAGAIKQAFIKVWFDSAQAMRDKLIEEGWPIDSTSPSFPKDKY